MNDYVRADLIRIATSDADVAIGVLVKRAAFGYSPMEKVAVPDWLKNIGQWGQENILTPASEGIGRGAAGLGLEKGWGSLQNAWNENPALRYGVYGAGLGGALGLAGGLLGRKKKRRAFGDALTGAALGGLLGGVGGQFLPGSWNKLFGNNGTIVPPGQESTIPGENKLRVTNPGGRTVDLDVAPIRQREGATPDTAPRSIAVTHDTNQPKSAPADIVGPTAVKQEPVLPENAPRMGQGVTGPTDVTLTPMGSRTPNWYSTTALRNKQTQLQSLEDDVNRLIKEKGAKHPETLSAAQAYREAVTGDRGGESLQAIQAGNAPISRTAAGMGEGALAGGALFSGIRSLPYVAHVAGSGATGLARVPLAFAGRRLGHRITGESYTPQEVTKTFLNARHAAGGLPGVKNYTQAAKEIMSRDSAALARGEAAILSDIERKMLLGAISQGKPSVANWLHGQRVPDPFARYMATAPGPVNLSRTAVGRPFFAAAQNPLFARPGLPPIRSIGRYGLTGATLGTLAGPALTHIYGATPYTTPYYQPGARNFFGTD